MTVVADSSGRLPPDALKELLELHRRAAGGPLQADHLLRKWVALLPAAPAVP
jgi:hypothetical protein